MKISLLSIFIILAVALPCHAAISPEEAKAKAYEFLMMKEIRLELNGYASWSRKKCYHFQGIPSDSLSIDVDMETGIVRNFGYVKCQTESQQVIIELKEAEDLSKKFLQRISKTSPNFSDLTKLDGVLYDRGASGKIYNFKWIKIINEVEYPFLIDAEFSAQTGQLTSFLLVESAITLHDLTPKISMDQALKIAGQNVSDFDPKWTVIDSNLSISVSVPQVLRWKVRIKGTQKLPYLPERGELQVTKIREIYIDANTGTIILSLTSTPRGNALVLKPPALQPNALETLQLWSNFSPTNNDILYYNWRELELDYPKVGTKAIDDRILAGDIRVYKGLISLAKANKVVPLLWFPSRPNHPTWNQENKRIAFEMWLGGPIYILDIETGEIGRVNDIERHQRSMPSWDSSGMRLVMSGTHLSYDKVGTDDDDIFVSAISKELSVNSADYHRCIAFLPGRDIFPVFTSEDKWVVFAHEEKQGDAKGWAIYRARPDKGFQDPEYFKPEKLVEGLPEPERISPFPDGKRVLVSYTGNEYEMKNPPQIVDIEAKTKIALRLPVLFDPDLPQGKPLVPREIAVSPDGKQIAFSALRWSGDPKDDGAILIYTCDLDGTNLKRITPPTDVPLEPYQYPQEGVTALNAWEKLQPKRNEGTGVMRGDVEGMRKLRDEATKQYEKKRREAIEKEDREKVAREAAEKELNVPAAP